MEVVLHPGPPDPPQRLHRRDLPQPRRGNDTPRQTEITPAAYPGVEPVPVEVEAGSTVSFGSMMVHQSRPNTSELDRRALLFSYQPAGAATMLDSFRRLAGRRPASPDER